MEEDFIAELPTVFNILKFNPEAIVDDTAIERLLSWLQEAAVSEKPQLLDNSFHLFKSPEIWSHSLTLSFALRFLGFLGCHYGATNSKIEEVVKTTLDEVVKHNLFNEASVQYAYFKCLQSLSSEVFWSDLLQKCLGTMMESFNNSYLYVKKSAVAFFASYIRTLVTTTTEITTKTEATATNNLLATVHQMVDSLTDGEQLYHVTESVYELSKSSIDVAATFLSQSCLIERLMRQSSATGGSERTKVVEALRTLFSIATRTEIQSSWSKILGDIGEERLIGLLKDAKKTPELGAMVPSICESLMSLGHGFSSGWNMTLLQSTLSDISVCDEQLTKIVDLEGDPKDLAVKEWKKQFVLTIGEMIKIEKKIHTDASAGTLLKSWRRLCLKVLSISLNKNTDGQVINEYLISVMYDNKIPRLCFQYLKESSFEVSDDTELTDLFLECMWNCLTCHTDTPQVVCSTLELLTSYISSDPTNISHVINHPDSTKPASSSTDPPISSLQYSFADVLNKLLWDISWEVQDSLIDVLLQIVHQAQSGSHVCNEFLAENTFWVRVIDLIDNQESYVRAKTVTFIGAVVGYNPLWDIFSLKQDQQIADLLQLLKEKFLCEKRQDDMFTRRSIIQVLRTWVRAKLECTSLLPTPTATTDTTSHTSNDSVRSHTIEILRNGSCDFDWEVRKLTFSWWLDLAVVASEGSDELKSSFIDLLSESCLALNLCNGVTDPEYLVKMEAFKCLSFVWSNFHHVFSEGSKQLKPIKTMHSITEYEDTLLPYKDMDRKAFECFIGGVDFEGVGGGLDVLDIKVSSDPVSFIQDVIASAKQSEANLLDCY